MSCQVVVTQTHAGISLECEQHGRERLGWSLSIDRLTKAYDEHMERHR